MPEGTAAPVAAPAPAAPAPSAPVVSTPAPSTPAPVATPAAPAVDSTPANDGAAASSGSDGTPSGTPAAAAPPAEKPGRPERAAYGDNIEKFLKDTYAWEEANPDGAEFVTGDEVPVAADAADDVAKREEEAKAPDAEDPAKPAEVAAPTPEALSRLLEATPGLKEVLEAHPEAKGALFQMARVNAKAAPILELLPNVEAAKFAVDTSNEFVNLRTAFTLSDSPGKMKDAAGMFLEQFAIVDDKGQPILDAKGNPTYGEDLPLFVSEIKGRDNAVRMADLKASIEANKFATPEGRDNAEQLLAAYEFIAAAEAAGPDAFDKPDTSTMTPEAKAYFERKEAELEAERERLGLKEKDLTTKQRAEKRAAYDTKYREQFGASTGKYMANYLKQKEAEGVAIPRYMLTMTDPKTGVSVFAQQAYQRLNAAIDKLPNIKSHSATLQMNAINDQGLAARVAYGQDRIDELLPGIIDGLLKEAGVSIAADAKAAVAARDERRTDARVEPSAGPAGSPKGKSSEQLMAQAKAEIAKEFPGFLEPEVRMRKELERKYKLEG